MLEPHLHLVGLSSAKVDVEFLTEDTWNRVFVIRDPALPVLTPEYIMRVSLPVFPWYKTQAEVATMEFVRMYTNIPVPRVFAFDSSADNCLGYEWMLVEKVAGRPYLEVEEHLTIVQKQEIARTLAGWRHQLSRFRFNIIGSLYRNWDYVAESKDGFYVGPPVIQKYMGDWRLSYKSFRGPFTNFEDYARSFAECIYAEACDPRQRIRAEIDALYKDIETLGPDCPPWKQKDRRPKSRLDAETQEEKAARPSRVEAMKQELAEKQRHAQDKFIDWEGTRYHVATYWGEPYDGLKESVGTCQQLLRLIPKFCDRAPFATGSTVLYHWDISDQNVLIDETGKPAALLDWEQLYTVPPLLTRPYPNVFDTLEEDEGAIQLSKWVSGDHNEMTTPDHLAKQNDLGSAVLMR